MSRRKKTTQEQKPQKQVQTLEINDSDQATYLTLLPEDYANNGQLSLALKILGDYKHLLELTPQKFWATIRYNLSLHDSLDLFLRYAPRTHFLHESQYPSGYYATIVQEIFKSVLSIYIRITDLANEDLLLYESIDSYELIYQNWIFDVMKLTDLAQIYGQTNRKSIQHISNFVFKYQAYEADFKTTIDSFQKNILNKLYEELMHINNKSVHDNQIFVNDITQKMENLIQAIDMTETLIVWAKFFPQKNYIFNPIKTLPILEQIFYELLIAKGFQRGQEIVQGAWKMNKLPINQTYLLEQVLQRIIEFFIHYLNYVQELAIQQQQKQLQDHVIYIVQSFGIVRRKGFSKKANKNDLKEWHLLEGIQEAGFALLDMLQNLIPWKQIQQVTLEEVDELIIIMSSVLTERERLKKNQDPVDVDQFENLNPENSNLKDVKSDDENENPLPPQPQLQQEESLSLVISKKKKQGTLDMPMAERIKFAELTSKMYNDEPDDTYDYQEALQRAEKDYSSSDDDEGYDKVGDMQYNNNRNLKVFQKRPVQSQHDLDDFEEKQYYQRQDHSDGESKNRGNDYQRDDNRNGKQNYNHSSKQSSQGQGQGQGQKKIMQRSNNNNNNNNNNYNNNNNNTQSNYYNSKGNYQSQDNQQYQNDNYNKKKDNNYQQNQYQQKDTQYYQKEKQSQQKDDDQDNMQIRDRDGAYIQKKQQNHQPKRKPLKLTSEPFKGKSQPQCEYVAKDDDEVDYVPKSNDQKHQKPQKNNKRR